MGRLSGPRTTAIRTRIEGPATKPFNLIILLPVYGDWESAKPLLGELDSALNDQPVTARVLFVDDCSIAPAPDNLATSELHNIAGVEILRLRRNLGHQRAIAIGLCFIHAERQCDAVLVMDADGEDKPEDVPRLIEAFVREGRRKVIFAQRGRRATTLTFRLFYFLYRWGHRLLTGIAVKVGNFSIIPAAHVATLVVVSDTWNHYAASVFKSRIPYTMLPTARGKRLAGESKMNFVALVLHGLSAISVFAEIVGARLTMAILGGVAVISALLVAVPVIRWGTDLAIPGWATTVAGLLLVIVLQMLTVAMGLTILVLFNRNNLSFLPLRDYRYFVGEVRKLYERAD
jgi:glycosyltransferase involved in cell wall biosynthesis